MPQVYTVGFNCSSSIGNNGVIQWWNFCIKKKLTRLEEKDLEYAQENSSFMLKSLVRRICELKITLFVCFLFITGL